MQVLAAFYQVPLWSLTQINHMPDSAPLERGQRVIVPRHLVPSAPKTGAVVRQSPSKP
ncbi:MAG: hypothetical protein ACLQB4_06855 [Beijerinckiaceae bacterium]